MNYRIGLFSIGLLAVVIGCDQKMTSPSSGRTYRVHAGFQDNATRVSLESVPSSLDMIAKWQTDDEIKILIYGTQNYLELPAVPVKNITDDGKDCMFSFTIPDDYEIDETGYRMVCYTIPPESDDLKKPRVEKETASIDFPLLRYPLDQFRAPVLFEGQVEENDVVIAFHHPYTYELLHIENATNIPIFFSLTGYKVTTWWFKITDKVEFTEDWFQAGGGGGGGGGSSWGNGGDSGGNGSWAPRHYTKQIVEPVRESPVTPVAPHGEAIIVSAYMPNGALITDAQMVALIDGNRVFSSNTISSKIELKTGHAYHIYAVWDGQELRFDKAFDSGSSEVDAGGNGYGSDTGGNLSGTGIGFGDDNSGTLSGSGSGYSNGN